jgi:hypothetical protein
MISDRCDIGAFVSLADKWEYQEIITQAEREASEAGRRFHHSNALEDEKTLCGPE